MWIYFIKWIFFLIKMVHVLAISASQLTWHGLCVSMLQNPAGTSPQGNISLADGYKQEWCSISRSSSTRWSHLISNVCMCVCMHVSLVPLQRHKQPARQCQTVSLYPRSTPASCLQTGWKLITLLLTPLQRPTPPPSITHLGTAPFLWSRALWVRSRRTTRLTWWWSVRTKQLLAPSI